MKESTPNQLECNCHCELCHHEMENTQLDNYGEGYYVRRLGGKIICGECTDKLNIQSTEVMTK